MKKNNRDIESNHRIGRDYYLELLQKYYRKLNRRPAQKLNKIGMDGLKTYLKKATYGVYVFYYQKKPIYVGCSVNIYTRIRDGHLKFSKKGSSSPFRAKLVRREIVPTYLETQEWILKNCSFKYISIEPELFNKKERNPYDLLILFEAFLIAKFRQRHHWKDEALIAKWQIKKSDKFNTKPSTLLNTEKRHTS